MDKLARLMERNGIDSLRQITMQEQENRIAELERTIEILLKGEMQEPEPTPEERMAEVEAVSDMAYINSELALAMLQELEV